MIWKPSKADEKSFVLVITNPTHSNVTVTLLPYCEQPEDKNLPQLCGRLTLPNDSFDIPAKETITDLDSGMIFKNLGDFEVKMRLRIRVKFKSSKSFSRGKAGGKFIHG